VEGPSIVVATEGSGKVTFNKGKGDGEEFQKGDVLFIGAGEEVQWEAGEGVEAYRAFVEA
jgi:mannose-6-phosphate isomerase